MKTINDLKQMLYARIAEIEAGGLTLAYDEQLRIEVALLYDILDDDIEDNARERIESNM